MDEVGHIVVFNNIHRAVLMLGCNPPYIVSIIDILECHVKEITRVYVT